MTTPDTESNHEITDYLLGEMSAMDELDFEATMRGNSDVRSQVHEEAEFAHLLEREMRIGPGGLTEDQRESVLDELDAVLAERTEAPARGGSFKKVVFGLRGVRPKVRQAFFSPTARALNAISVAAAVIIVAVTGFNMGMIKGGDKARADVADTPEGEDVQPLATIPEAPTQLAMPQLAVGVLAPWDDTGFFVDDESLYDEVLAEVVAGAELSGDESDSGFRLAREQSRSAVPVVSDSDFYETLWTKVRRESELPQRDSVAIEELVNYFPYNYPQPKFGDRLRLSVETGVCPWNSQHALVRIGIRARDLVDGGRDVVAKDLGVVADFNPAVVRGYRLLGYAQCSQDPEKGAVLRSDGLGTELRGSQTVTALYEVIPLGSDEDVSDAIVTDDRLLKTKGKPHPIGLHAGMFARKSGLVSHDLLNVRVIYRVPGSLNYSRREVNVASQAGEWDEMDDDFRFAVAVSAFGLLLKGELEETEIDFDTIGQLAAGAVGSDVDGRRAEFLALVKHVRVLQPELIKPTGGPLYGGGVNASQPITAPVYGGAVNR